MKRKALALVIPFFLVGLIPAAPRGRLADPLQSAAPAPGQYENSAEGLQKFLVELQAAVKAQDKMAFERLAADLKLPEAALWFAGVFGPVEGPNLVVHYAKTLPTLREYLWTGLGTEVKQGRSVFRVEPILPTAEKPAYGVIEAMRTAMVEPVAFYDVDTTSPEGKSPVALGYFFFIDGKFRFVHYGVFYWLSNFTPRIRVGGQVMASKFISQSRSRYPQAAKDLRIQGTVRMQAVISTDGRVAELTLLSGHPYLVDAAMGAVRLWRYQPTLLNGRPVEVVTTIDVVFTLSR